MFVYQRTNWFIIGYADLTPEEFEELLREYPNLRFPPGYYEQGADNASIVQKAEQVENVETKKIKSTSILGDSPLNRIKLGTIQLPEELMKRTDLLLRGMFPSLSSN